MAAKKAIQGINTISTEDLAEAYFLHASNHLGLLLISK